MLVATAFLFGGVSRAADEESLQSAATQSANITAEAQSSGAVTTTAATGNEQPTSCNPRNISPEEIQTDFKTQDGSEELTAYEAVEFSVNLTLGEGHCAGDQAVISVPNEFGTDGDNNPVPMTTPSGVVIGIATYDGPTHTVTVRLTDQVEVPGRKDIHAAAWWRVHMSSSLIPGETRELVWNLDGVTRRTVIHVGTCDGCSQVGKDPSKWGSADGERQHITIVLPTATQDGQVFTVTDTLTSPGQRFDCNRLTAGRVGVYHSAGPWGQPMYDRFQDPTVVSCTDDKVTLNIQLNTGEKARVELNINVSATDPGPWTDVANITSQELSWDVSAQIIRRESGGNAGFDNTPTPAPTPEPSPTPVPTPTPTPSPTPTPTPSTSPTPAPSPSPSATPTPTPSTTSAPSPTPTPSPSTTPSATPVPTPTPSTTLSPSATPAPAPTPEPAPQHKLAVTGAAGSAAASAVALLTLGGLALRARRHQTARSEN